MWPENSVRKGSLSDVMAVLGSLIPGTQSPIAPGVAKNDQGWTQRFLRTLPEWPRISHP